MTKYLLLKFLFVLLFSATGKKVISQVLTPQAVNVGGTSQLAGNILLESSVGGLVVQDVTNAVFIYTPDFLQPDKGITNTPPELGGPGGGVRLIAGAGIDNAGTSFVQTADGKNLMIEFTVAEMASITLTNPENMVTQGILQPFTVTSNTTLPVLGFEFYAKRLNKEQVQLDWKTQQEINNRGFWVERKKENENSFAAVKFLDSKGQNGNAASPLNYLHIDTNTFAGKTYYRLKQEDRGGRFIYSVIRIVAGETGKSFTLKIWPVPAPREFSVTINGIEKDELIIYDASGRMVKQIVVNDGQVTTVSSLAPGSYIVQLKSQPGITQKILVQ